MSQLSQEEIIVLPSPPFIPARDMMLCERESQTVGGIHLPDETVDKIQVCRVLAVGPGLLLDSGAYKKSQYQRGDRILTTPNDGYPLKIDGKTYWVFEQNEVVGQITDENASVDGGRDVC